MKTWGTTIFQDINSKSMAVARNVNNRKAPVKKLLKSFWTGALYFSRGLPLIRRRTSRLRISICLVSNANGSSHKPIYLEGKKHLLAGSSYAGRRYTGVLRISIL